MRLSRPVYETLPLFYVLIGVLGFVLAYLDPNGARGLIAFIIGVLAEIAALTVFLHRHDYRAQSREYSGETVELPSTLHGSRFG
jgi:hypothetical protein